jgi:phospholipid/cholesterol/gamma-HCH transport system substrate-binding protein
VTLDTGTLHQLITICTQGERLAPPLVKGQALLRRRVAGVVFLVVMLLLVQLAVALYQKKFTPTVEVALRTDRAGNQLSVHADVKLRGIVVGEVRSIRSRGDGAVLTLALDPGKSALVPRNVLAQLLPKTLFGEKEVALVLPPAPDPQHLRRGDTISQDRSSTALETETALNDALPLLKSLEPQKLSMTLNALSAALRGRGDALGNQLALNAAYFRRLNPSLPTLAQDMAGLADLAGTTADATPDLLRTLDNLSFSGRSLVEQRTALDTFLKSTSDFAATTTQVVGANEQRFVALARDSKPSLDLFAKYSANYPCLLNRVAYSEIEGERTFGGAQPGLHITVEVNLDQKGYAAGDEPQNKEKRTSLCYGLGPKPIIPFPAYANLQDGYRDSAPPETPNSGPPNCCYPPKAASWMASIGQSPSVTVVRTLAMPRSTTPFEALLLAPLAGLGT